MPVYFFGRNGIFRGGLESDLGVAAPRRFHDFPKSAPVGIPATGPALIDFNCLHNGPTWVLPQIDWTIVRSDKRQTPKNLVIRPCGHVITSRRTFRTHIYVSISDSIRARYIRVVGIVFVFRNALLETCRRKMRRHSLWRAFIAQRRSLKIRE
jgi:hypothetical protein